MIPLFQRGSAVLAFALAALAAGGASAERPPRSDWTLDPGLYAFIPGMSGHVFIGNNDIDLGAPSDAILSINGFFMGNVRLGYKQFGLNVDVFYGDLNDSHGGNGIDIAELIVEPTLSYKVLPWLEALAGFRYDDLSADATGPFGRVHSGTSYWFDPIVGALLSWSISDSVALKFRGDVGGFGVGSHFTYQAFPYVDWQVAKILSLQGGYRVLYINYEQGTLGAGGGTYVKYDVTELGFQLGLKFHLDL